MWADPDALIAFNTLGWIPYHLSVLNRQGSLRTRSHTYTAVITEIDHVGIMAVEAVEIAALKEHYGAVAGTVNEALGQQFADEAEHGSAAISPASLALIHHIYRSHPFPQNAQTSLYEIWVRNMPIHVLPTTLLSDIDPTGQLLTLTDGS